MQELIADIIKKQPTISLVIGGSHSIGIPLAVATDCSFIVPSATMLAHPVRMSGTVLGAPQTYYQFNQMQERIIGFICRHAAIKKTRLEELMLAKDTMAKDLGTILVGEEAVNEGLISHVVQTGDASADLGKNDSRQKDGAKRRVICRKVIMTASGKYGNIKKLVKSHIWRSLCHYCTLFSWG